MASFIEWTCPASGTYYVLVRGYQRESGTFQLMIADTTTGAHLNGGSSGDPCVSIQAIQAPSAGSIPDDISERCVQ